MVNQSTRANGCIREAFRLKSENRSNGLVVWVHQFDGRVVCHAYYLPNRKELDKPALNQEDNGFEGYPRLTVNQVLRNGITLHSLEDSSFKLAYLLF